MRRLGLIFCSLALSCVFMFFSPKWEMGFPFSDIVMPAENWFYYFFEHVILVLLALAIVSEATEFKFALWTFVCIQIIDTLDYALFYGQPWLKGFPSWNILKVFIFGASMVYERQK